MKGDFFVGFVLIFFRNTIIILKKKIVEQGGFI